MKTEKQLWTCKGGPFHGTCHVVDNLDSINVTFPMKTGEMDLVNLPIFDVARYRAHREKRELHFVEIQSRVEFVRRSQRKMIQAGWEYDETIGWYYPERKEDTCQSCGAVKGAR